MGGRQESEWKGWRVGGRNGHCKHAEVFDYIKPSQLHAGSLGTLQLIVVLTNTPESFIFITDTN